MSEESTVWYVTTHFVQWIVSVFDSSATACNGVAIQVKSNFNLTVLTARCFHLASSGGCGALSWRPDICIKRFTAQIELRTIVGNCERMEETRRNLLLNSIFSV